jgi:hypothetical protein
MLNSASVTTVNSAKFSQRFTQPCYSSYCFARIPATIQFLLTGQGQNTLPMDVLGDLPSSSYEKVIFLFIDAFGWRFFERYAEKYPFLKRALEYGCVSKLTSQFPSTTAAHVTCIHTGLDVGQSGVYEWTYYEPLVDDIISPLLFSYAVDKLTRDTLKPAGVAPSAFFPSRTFYQKLQAQGIESHIIQHQDYTNSTYSNIVFRGGEVHPYHNLQGACTMMAELLKEPVQGKAYYFFYFDRIDAVCHNYGPNSKQFEEIVDASLRTLEQVFFQAAEGKVGNTLLLLSADHGQVEVNPNKTYYLNKQIPTIARAMKLNRRGRVIAPAGSARDMFLHVKEEQIDSLIEQLRQRLENRAEVYRVQDLMAQGFFGSGTPARVFTERVGNVVVLPYKHESVWWYEEGVFSMHFQGHHGGLTPEEMEIPLLAVPM